MNAFDRAEPIPIPAPKPRTMETTVPKAHEYLVFEDRIGVVCYDCGADMPIVEMPARSDRDGTTLVCLPHYCSQAVCAECEQPLMEAIRLGKDGGPPSPPEWRCMGRCNESFFDRPTGPGKCPHCGEGLMEIVSCTEGPLMHPRGPLQFCNEACLKTWCAESRQRCPKQDEECRRMDHWSCHRTPERETL